MALDRLKVSRELEQERIDNPKMEYYRHVFADSPRWDGQESLRNKKVLVYMEQGFGDAIQFLRYIPKLLKHDCELTVCCPIELERLVENTFRVNFHSKDDPSLPEHDLHILSFSLPFLLCDTMKSHCHFNFPYLTAPKNDEVSGLGKKIGICWEGSPVHWTNSWRSCHLSNFLHLQRNLDVKLFCLQKDIHNTDLCQGCEDLELFGVELRDFWDTAKLINSMDCVVTVDTSILHLAGALNKKTFALMTKATDGRFGYTKSTSVYPSLSLIWNRNLIPDLMGIPKTNSPVEGWGKIFKIDLISAIINYL